MSNEEFSERVKKTFGNLLANVTPTPNPSSLSNPLWSLTGAEIEKRQWRRDQDSSDRDNNPCASSFDDFVSCARKNSRNNIKNYKKEFDNDDDFHAFDDDDDGDDGDDDDGKGGDLDDWDLRGSIGLDSTLDMSRGPKNLVRVAEQLMAMENDGAMHVIQALSCIQLFVVLASIYASSSAERDSISILGSNSCRLLLWYESLWPLAFSGFEMVYFFIFVYFGLGGPVKEEEDDYDKVAIGRENAGDRLYMSVIAEKNAPSFVPPNGLSPDSGGRRRDPRANRLAARIRLKEDDAEVGVQTGKHKTPPASAEKEPVSSTGNVNQVKPILKRKEHEGSTSKPPKRVRFDPEYVIDKNPPANVTRANPPLTDGVGRLAQIPDYVQNPTKYTCYSLDSADEINDKSKDGLHEMSKSQNSGSQSGLEDALSGLPKSVTFVPKRKPDSSEGDGVSCESSNDGDSDLKHSSTQSASVAGFVDEDFRESEVGDMEVDGPETSAELGITSQKRDRQYRTKSLADEQE
ncbi:hypothetical protein KSS87_019936 [Heliosperma pusillum]|nr:hypothetical protein KSS87_019936 [Heliosperma pusillum]